MGPCYSAPSRSDREHCNTINPEAVQGGAGPDNIGNCIIGSYFVEVRTSTMHTLLRSGNPLKNATRDHTRCLRRICRIATGQDMVKGPVRMSGTGLDANGLDPAARHSHNFRVSYDRAHGMRYTIAICAAIKNGRCDHVTGSAVERIENEYAHSSDSTYKSLRI